MIWWQDSNSEPKRPSDKKLNLRQKVFHLLGNFVHKHFMSSKSTSLSMFYLISVQVKCTRFNRKCFSISLIFAGKKKKKPCTILAWSERSGRKKRRLSSYIRVHTHVNYCIGPWPIWWMDEEKGTLVIYPSLALFLYFSLVCSLRYFPPPLFLSSRKQNSTPLHHQRIKK